MYGDQLVLSGLVLPWMTFKSQSQGHLAFESHKISEIMTFYPFTLIAVSHLRIMLNVLTLWIKLLLGHQTTPKYVYKGWSIDVYIRF